MRINKNMYRNQRAAIRVNNDKGEHQDIKQGVRQGCVPDLFILHSENIMGSHQKLE